MTTRLTFLPDAIFFFMFIVGNSKSGLANALVWHHPRPSTPTSLVQSILGWLRKQSGRLTTVLFYIKKVTKEFLQTILVKHLHLLLLQHSYS